MEDAVCSVFSKEYLTEPDLYVTTDNHVYVNFSIIKTFPVGTQSHFQITGATLGEYVMDFGVDVITDFCEVIREPVIVGPVANKIGFFKTDCPPSPGVYGNENIEIPMDHLPDRLVPNKYRLTWELLHKTEKLFVILTYIVVR
ncbi:GSCOCG00006882001-RA-CDS [Cotesia congregata]|nr:GSCOCG00006882001-RA-CDS [Cotesia congregata]